MNINENNMNLGALFSFSFDGMQHRLNQADLAVII